MELGFTISFSFIAFVFFMSTINLKPLPERIGMVCVSVGDVKKLLKVMQMESMKARLRGSCDLIFSFFLSFF